MNWTQISLQRPEEPGKTIYTVQLGVLYPPNRFVMSMGSVTAEVPRRYWLVKNDGVATNGSPTDSYVVDCPNRCV